MKPYYLVALLVTTASADHHHLKPLTDALTLHASFDNGTSADYAKGDPSLLTWTDRKQNTTSPGLPADAKTTISKNVGKFGDALKFTSNDTAWVFFPAEKNIAYNTGNFAGTISLWLRCDPVDGLAPGYCDPVQLTTRAWNDASFFVDFNKQGSPRDFRLGAFADLTVWNPTRADVPEDKRPLVTAKTKPAFAADRWTHVAFTWENFNTGDESATAKLYIDGQLDGTITGWNQQFTWKPDETPRLLLGLNYIGLIDEVSCFDRALTQQQVKSLHSLKTGMTPLLPKK